MKRVAVALMLFSVCSALPAYGDFARAREAYLMKDYPKALKMFMNEDDQASLYMIGYMYDHGEGVAQDGKQATEWYAKAADKGSVKAMYRLGVMYSNGYGIDKDLTEAKKWYKKAAFKGFLPAKEALKRLEEGK